MVRPASAVRSRLARLPLDVIGLAVVAYLPFVLSDPGAVAGDSKQSLLLDPSRFLARAPFLWDGSFAAGTLTHQNLGYLWPVGPFFWLGDQVGLPVWVTQRLWMGTLTFLAALGARWLLRHLGVGRVGALAGALLYALSPYQLAYMSRMSVLLLPWAGLPWIVELTRRAVSWGGWRHPALAALVIASVSSINASAVLLVAPGPLLVLAAHAAGGRRQAAEAVRTALRIGVLTVPICAWWLAGLRVQGAYGLPVLHITENLETVAVWSTPLDVLRGIGNWIFYGTDHSGYSIDQAAAYLEDPWVVASSFAVPVMALVAALVVRWRHRALAVALVVTGTVLAVGAWPYDDPSPYGRLYRWFGEDTTLGLAFRNTPRAVPLVLVGAAMVVGATVTAVRSESRRRVVGALAVVLVLGAAGPVWTTGYLTDRHARPEEVPDHWQDAIARLDEGDPATRVLAVPGINFAAYRWGNAVEPITPGLTDRGFVAREVLPWGSVASATFLDAIDRRVQLGIVEPESIAPMARLFGVGDVLLRSDVDTARYDLRDTHELWTALLAAPGLATPTTFDDPAGPEGGPPDVAVFAVDDPRSIVRVAPHAQPVVLAGDADGMIDASAAGLLDGQALVLLSAALDDAQLDDSLDQGADLILTDTNRRRIQTWFYSIRDTRGPTEQEGETLVEPSGYDARLDPLAAAGDDGRSVVRQVGGSVTASTSGGAERPESRAVAAIDGTADTAWEIPARSAVGARWAVEADSDVEVDRVTVVQALRGAGAPTITSIRLTAGDAPPIDVTLDDRSRTPDGQEVLVPGGLIDRIGIEITGVAGPTADARLDLVGLAEVRSAIGPVTETVRLPVDMLDRAGERSIEHGLDIVLTRLRLHRDTQGRRDEERSIDRTFDLPTPRSFTASGTARPSAELALAATDAAIGADCRSDLLLVDGEPVSVRLGDADDGGTTAIELCDGAIELAAGEHRLQTAAGADSGIDVDRLVLSSAPGGDAGPLGARGLRADEVGTEITDLDEGRVTVTADLSTDGVPFWFVLGQSSNDGWEIDVTGGEAGERQLVDGYANGWLIEPDGPGAVAVTVRWAPQRVIWAGIAVSAATALACVGIVVRTRARRWDDAFANPADEPGLRMPFGAVVDLRSGLGACLAAALVTGTLMGLVSGPVIGFGAAVVAAGLVWSRAVWWFAALGAPTLLVAAHRLDRPSLAWAALALVVADVVARILIRRWPRAPR